MKRLIQINGIVLILLAVMFSGCSTKQPAGAKDTIKQEISQSTPDKLTQEQSMSATPAAKPEQAQSSGVKTGASAPVKISYKVHSEIIKDDKDGKTLLDLKITYPQIDNPGKDKNISTINEYYDKQCSDFTAKILSEGVKNAAADKEAAKSGGYEFHYHAYERSPCIYYNGNGLLSVLNVQYENTGGAHPNSFWSSETFDVKTGKKLSLAGIFGLSKEKALEKVYETVLSQIKKTEDTGKFVYNPGYKDDVKKYYSEDDFVLTNDSIMFYYQIYSIAPYAAGIQFFKLPLEKAGTPAASVPALPENELETELFEQAGKLIDRNTTNFCEIFGLSMLKMEISEEKTDKEVLFPVIDERFPTYAAFDGYVRSTYVKKEADALLSNGRYHNTNGKLYGDLSKDAGMGYYVDWNNYRYEINDITEKTAVLKIFITDDSPAGKKDTAITVNIHKENGIWLLKKMFH